MFSTSCDMRIRNGGLNRRPCSSVNSNTDASRSSSIDASTGSPPIADKRPGLVSLLRFERDGLFELEINYFGISTTIKIFMFYRTLRIDETGLGSFELTTSVVASSILAFRATNSSQISQASLYSVLFV
jgi:hypothetical protein